MKEEVLVSVVVIAYQSEKYILETLESIKNQTYSKLELIISDDCSGDNTVALAKKWSQENEQRFSKVTILAGEENLGLPGNFNRGFAASHGKYIKLIAADDILVPECIEVMVTECEAKQYSLLLARMKSFYKGDDLKEMPINREFYGMDAEEQYKHLLVVNEGTAPTVMYRADLLKQMHGLDERYRLMEDYPFWLKVTKAGIKMNLCDFVAVHYRRNDDSATSTTNEKVVGKAYFKTCKKFYYEKRLFPLLRNGEFRAVLREEKEFLYKDLVLLFGNQRNSKATQRLYHLFYK